MALLHVSPYFFFFVPFLTDNRFVSMDVWDRMNTPNTSNSINTPVQIFSLYKTDIQTVVWGWLLSIGIHGMYTSNYSTKKDQVTADILVSPVICLGAIIRKNIPVAATISSKDTWWQHHHDNRTKWDLTLTENCYGNTGISSRYWIIFFCKLLHVTVAFSGE